MTHLPTLEIERRVLRELRADLTRLHRQIAGMGAFEAGQRRGVTRALQCLDARYNQNDDGVSYSADDIDEGLKA